MPLELRPGEVHWCCVSLDAPAAAVTRLYATLADNERDRSARFRFERDERRFIVARGLLREILGCYLRAAPGTIRFVYNPFGKPELSPEFGRLAFNLSHSGDRALIAVALDSAVGVDLEYVPEEEGAHYTEIARCFFSTDEVEQLQAVPSHARAREFFRCWTRHEAYVKARGAGLGDAPVDPEPGWCLFTLQPALSYVGAVAVEGQVAPRISQAAPATL